MVTESFPQKFGFNTVRDIHVPAPIYRSPAGVIALNECLQEELNPPANNKPERKLYRTIFPLGDKVMQTQNNYEKDVYKGDIDFIRSMDITEQALIVDFDGRPVTYNWSGY